MSCFSMCKRFMHLERCERRTSTMRSCCRHLVDSGCHFVLVAVAGSLRQLWNIALFELVVTFFFKFPFIPFKLFETLLLNHCLWWWWGNKFKSNSECFKCYFKVSTLLTLVELSFVAACHPSQIQAIIVEHLTPPTPDRAKVLNVLKSWAPQGSG